MAFKDIPPQLEMIDVTLIDPDPAHPRRQIDEAALKGLVNSIRKAGLIHPLVVQPADAAGRYRLIVGTRRWRAAFLAGESHVPALVRPCDAAEAFEIQAFENLGLGVRSALEPRDMANAIQAIAERFESEALAADHFGRSTAWLSQATAAANLSPKVTALLESGKISSTSTAVQLEKLAQKDGAKADFLLGQIEQLPEGEKIAKRVVDSALSAVSGRRKKEDEAIEEVIDKAAPASETERSEPAQVQPHAQQISDTAAEPAASDVPLASSAPNAVSASPRTPVNASKVKRVAAMLGVAADDEAELLARLVDAFLASQGAEDMA